MALFEVTAYDKRVWEEELRDFLPDKILDVHTHVYKKEFFDPPKESEDSRGLVSWIYTVADENPIEDLVETYDLMFPGKEVSALMFVSGNTGLDKNNAYLSEVSRKSFFYLLIKIITQIRSNGYIIRSLT